MTARQWPPWWVWLLIVLPPWWSSPGRIAADTKIYLSVNPSDLLAQAPVLWDADVGLGTVTHQTIGYLFPQGPWWWVADLIGLPDWVTQRLWWIAIVAVAVVGAQRLATVCGLATHGAVVAACAYGFSPYLFQYISRISAILLPWAALPWMILALRHAVIRGGWRDAARFALIVLVAGTVNATSIVFAVVGAVVWVVATWGVRTCLPSIIRAGVCSAAVSSWWVVALIVQGRHGIDILRFTETYDTIASTALPTELLRGAGYWFSYGGDWLDPWVGATAGLLAHPLYVALGLVMAAVGVAGVMVVPTPGRRPAALALLVGLMMAVGSASVGRWTPWGLIFDEIVGSDLGMSLRSTPRAAPIMLLGCAVGLGAVADAVTSQRHQHPFIRTARRWAVVVGIVGLAAPWFTGSIVTEAITHDTIPTDVLDAAAAANSVATSDDSRVWVTPGADFASYRWGGTIDPIEVGVLDRPTVARELIPLGTDGSADLVGEIERRVAENTLDATAIAPLARMMGVDTVMARNDLEFERYATARPDDVTERLDAAGLERVFTGAVVPHDEALIDEQTFGGVPGIGAQPTRAVWTVPDVPAVVSLHSGSIAAVQGSAATIVAAAEHGLVSGHEMLVDADSSSDALADVGGIDWVIIGDSNRDEDRRWYSIGSVLGATRIDGISSDDPSLQSLVTAPADQQTRAMLDGPVMSVTASGYGSPAILSGEDRPTHAVDGDPFTAWRAAALEATAGTWIDLVLDAPTTPRDVVLVQPVTGERDRYITRARVMVAADAVDDGSWRHVDVELGPQSRTVAGQRVILDGQLVDRLRIEVLADNVGPLPGYGNSAGVGFAEIIIDGVGPTHEWVVMPTDLSVDRLDATRTTVVFDRRRLDAAIPNRFDPEPLIRREFTLANEMNVTVSGAVAPSAHDPRPHPVLKESSAGLVGVDQVLWVSEFDPVDPFVVVTPDPDDNEPLVVHLMDGPIVSPVEHIVVTDSVGATMTVPVNDAMAIVDRAAVAAGSLRLDLRVTSPATTRDPFSDRARVLPVGIVDMSPVVRSATRDLPVGCVEDLVMIDGIGVAVRVDGGAFIACAPVALGVGTHRLETAPGHVSGVDVNRVVLDTGPASMMSQRTDVAIIRDDTQVTAQLDAAADGRWLIFAESHSSGWTATLDGADLGPPIMVNGYAMGWWVPAGSAGELTIVWTPQNVVRWGLAFGAVSTVVVAIIACRRRRRDGVGDDEPARVHGPLFPVAALILAGGPLAFAAPVVAPALRRRNRLSAVILLAPVAVAWAWVAAREVRWDPPLDLRWPSGFAWVQPWVMALVFSVVWVAGITHVPAPSTSCDSRTTDDGDIAGEWSDGVEGDNQ